MWWWNREQPTPVPSQDVGKGQHFNFTDIECWEGGLAIKSWWSPRPTRLLNCSAEHSSDEWALNLLGKNSSESKLKFVLNSNKFHKVW